MRVFQKRWLVALQNALADDRLEPLVGVTPEHACASDFVPTPDTQSAAWLLAKANGMCRLFDVDRGDDAGPLPVSVAIAAGEVLVQELTQALESLDSLHTDWLKADPFEANDMCCSLLELRMAAWAVSEVLDDSFEVCLEETGFSADRLFDLQFEIGEQVMAFDDALQHEVDVLATVSDLPLLSRWRSHLAPDFSTVLPWWLNGMLEEVARDSAQLALSRTPSLAAKG